MLCRVEEGKSWAAASQRDRYDEVDGVGSGWVGPTDENFRGGWLIKRGASNWQTGTIDRLCRVPCEFQNVRGR